MHWKDGAINILNNLIEKIGSARKFARIISEDPADVHRWLKGQKIKPRATVTICSTYNINPHLLRPDLFPIGLGFTFEKGKKNGPSSKEARD